MTGEVKVLKDIIDDVYKKLANEQDITKKLVQKVLETEIDVLEENFAQQNIVKISHLGKFYPLKFKAVEPKAEKKVAGKVWKNTKGHPSGWKIKFKHSKKFFDKE